MLASPRAVSDGPVTAALSNANASGPFDWRMINEKTL